MMSYYTPYSALQDLLRHYNANKNETDKLPTIPYHRLRHTSATLLIAAHQDVRTVSNRLGHAQASTTTNIYFEMMQGGIRVNPLDIVTTTDYSKNEFEKF